MSMTKIDGAINPYLMFDGRCEEAIEFYKRALGAEVVRLMRFKENPEPPAGGCGPAPGTEEKIMHSTLRIGQTLIMASDGRCTGKPSFHGISLTLGVKTDAEAERAFKALSDGGQVQMPMTKTFFSSRFGMVADRFGVGWMVLVSQQ
jgi:PhnB protein